MRSRRPRLRATALRLDRELVGMTAAQNWRLRQERAVNIIDWALQGLLGADDILSQLPAYEARCLFRTLCLQDLYMYYS